MRRNAEANFLPRTYYDFVSGIEVRTYKNFHKNILVICLVTLIISKLKGYDEIKITIRLILLFFSQKKK